MFDKIKKWAVDNKYELLESIPGNWDRYGDGIPSVTTILSLLKDPGFEFVKRTYSNEVQAACERGTQTHKDAEDFFDGNSIEIHNQIMKFHILYDVTIISTEKRWVKDGIQGTIDLSAHLGSFMDCDLNVDYKSSPKKSKKYELQCGGYEFLNGLKGGVLYLSKKDFDFKLAPSGSMELFLELKDYFFSLLDKGTIKTDGRIYCDSPDI